ncbi:very short patch repair endonuclease [Caenispirillum bisanense]|uniref:Very short patch repair endonuclease n=1 Tax=Caenispirillum bisanense TaxID=414052 RepID=A0A286GN72_9PROT|nr:DNA mismatch endonuclease Vsr [Caenispirillum bisanense]SOD96529.1 T/G mismatch-specific endonuclease [Caenispirillum bisanense]
MSGIPSVVTDPERSRLMTRVRQKGTAPELVVRGILRSLHLGYRLQARDLPGSPDIVNRRRRWAVFVHGCYWHHHTSCRRATVPKRNHEFWTAKFAANRRRDARVVRDLRRRGYRVVIVWECETAAPDVLAARLERILAHR